MCKLLKKQILETAIKNASAPAPAAGMFSFGPPPTPLPFKGLSPADLDMKDGKVFVKADPSKSVTLAQAMRDAHFVRNLFGRKPPTALWATGMEISRHHEYRNVRGRVDAVNGTSRYNPVWSGRRFPEK